MNKVSSIIACAAFAAGPAVGWIAGTSVESNVAFETGKSEPGGRQRIADSGIRVKTVTTVVTNTIHSADVDMENSGDERQRGSGGFMAELERMKTDDPERYTAMTNRMAHFRNQMMRRTESKLETLAAIDTTGWNRRHIEIHEKYQDMIARREELMETVRHDSGATQEERNAAFAELRDLGREIRQISAQERNILLDKTFRELGYSGSDSAEIREAVKTIYSATEEWGGHGRHGRR